MEKIKYNEEIDKVIYELTVPPSKKNSKSGATVIERAVEH